MPHDVASGRIPGVLKIPSGQWQLYLEQLRRADPLAVHKWLVDAKWTLRVELSRLRVIQRRFTMVDACVVEIWRARQAFLAGRLDDLVRLSAATDQRGRMRGGAEAVARARMKSEGGSDKFIRAQAGWAT